MTAVLNILSVAVIVVQIVTGEWVELTGTFQDGQQGRVEIAMDRSSMIVVVRKPDHSGQFRETSNLHIFETHMVAIKDDRDRTCFIQTFNTTHDEMEHRVQEAKGHNHDIGPLKKVWIDKTNLFEFEPESVQLLFGSEIALYCHLYRVVYVDSRHSGLVSTDNGDAVPPRRPRRRTQITVIDSDNGPGGPIDIGTIC